MKTEGIKYAGSKLKIIPDILHMINDLDIKTVLDGFSGTTRVSQAFAQTGYRTTSLDISAWSKVFGECYLLNKEQPEYYKSMINHLNNVTPIHGWFTENYGGDIHTPKKPFQIKNTMKLDAIREEVDNMGLMGVERSVALTSLILAMDRVDNTMGHYSSYLAEWSKRSYNDVHLQVPNLFVNEQDNFVVQDDIFNHIHDNEYDLVYLDPPYGSNNDKMPSSRVRYASYYHIWTSIINNDKPQLFGKVGRREDTRDKVSTSIFEEYRKDGNGRFIAMDALDRLISGLKSKYILLSYSSGGRATKNDLYDILNRNGRVIKSVEIDYKKNVMSNMRWTNEWVNSDGRHHEYLFLLKTY